MKHYPYIVYRYQPGFYGNVTINFVDDELLLSEGTGRTIHWDGQVYDEAGKITPECREALRAFGIKEKERSRFRLCVVYGPNDCDYFERGGVVNPSNSPPSMKIELSGGDHDMEIVNNSGFGRIDECNLSKAADNPVLEKS